MPYISQQALEDEIKRRGLDKTSDDNDYQKTVSQLTKQQPLTTIKRQDPGIGTRLVNTLSNYLSDIGQTGEQLASKPVSAVSDLGKGTIEGLYRGAYGAGLPQAGQYAGQKIDDLINAIAGTHLQSPDAPQPALGQSAPERVGIGLGQGTTAVVPASKLAQVAKAEPALANVSPRLINPAILSAMSAYTEPDDRPLAATMGAMPSALHEGARGIKGIKRGGQQALDKGQQAVRQYRQRQQAKEDAYINQPQFQRETIKKQIPNLLPDDLDYNDINQSIERDIKSHHDKVFNQNKKNFQSLEHLANQHDLTGPQMVLPEQPEVELIDKEPKTVISHFKKTTHSRNKDPLTGERNYTVKSIDPLTGQKIYKEKTTKTTAKEPVYKTVSGQTEEVPVKSEAKLDLDDSLQPLNKLYKIAEKFPKYKYLRNIINNFNNHTNYNNARMLLRHLNDKETDIEKMGDSDDKPYMIPAINDVKTALNNDIHRNLKEKIGPEASERYSEALKYHRDKMRPFRTQSVLKNFVKDEKEPDFNTLADKLAKNPNVLRYVSDDLPKETKNKLALKLFKNELSPKNGGVQVTNPDKILTRYQDLFSDNKTHLLPDQLNEFLKDSLQHQTEYPPDESVSNKPKVKELLKTGGKILGGYEVVKLLNDLF